MPQLTGSSQAISLGQGYALRTPGIRGTAELLFPPRAADRSRSRAPEDVTPALDTAPAATSVTEVRIIELHLVARPPADVMRALRGVDGEETTGVLRWHFPVDEHPPVQSSTTRSASDVKRFRIPATGHDRPVRATRPGTTRSGSSGVSC
jgi:hypothetical protein